MARSSQPSSRDTSMSPSSARSRECEIPGRWSEYLGAYWNVGYEGKPPKFASSPKGLNLQWLIQLTHVSRGLLAKMYSLTRILDSSDPLHHSDTFWRSGVFPNSPRICTFLAKKFPDHHSKLQLERVDRDGLDALHSNGEVHLQNLESWFQLLVDLITFREQALQIILDLSSTVITLLPHQNSIILHAFMDIFCSFIRVNIFSEKIPRKMILQVYNLLHSLLRNDRECDFYHRLVQFIDSYDPPLKGLQEDLNFVSPRIGEVLEAVGPVIFLSTDTRKLRNEGFLSPFHPRYPDILTNSAHPMRAQDLANVTSYREWVLFGYLVCPDELLRMTSIDIVAVVLKENLIMELFRDEHIQLHEEYQLHVLPRILESKKIAKAGRTKQKEAELEYSISKQVEKMLSDVQEQALFSCEVIHRERRILLKQEIGKMVLFFSDQPSLLAPNIQMVFSTLALSRSEILWYFQHIGIAGKSKVTRVVPVNIDPNDPTIGFLVDGMDSLCNLVRKYSEAIKGYALSHILSSPGRIRFLMNTPGMIALDIDENLKGLFLLIVQHLENIPKPQSECISAMTYDFSDLRKNWVSILMIISSVRSSINVRHLERATVSTGKEGLMFEGNAAYNWSRCVDDLELELLKHGSLKKLYFFHQHLTSVFKNTMFGPEGRPQHCCAWLSIASSFPECASPVVTDEVSKIGRDAVSYVEWLIESIMGGLEGLINILDSDGGFGSLDMQLSPEQAAAIMNYTPGASLSYSSKSPKSIAAVSLPGHESYPETCGSTKMLEGAMQRLTSLCSVLNDMEPICVLNHVFVLREFMRECILGNFRRRLLFVLKTSDDDIQRPSVMKSLLSRHMMIVHLCEHNITMDLTQGIREVFITEIFTGPVSSLHLFQNVAERSTGLGTEIVCDWYIDKVIKDVSGAGLLYAPAHRRFKSTRPVGVCFADSITDIKELKAFVHIFGGYGVDRLHRMLKEHMEDLLNSIKMSLRSNSDVLEAFSKSECSGYGMGKEANFIQIAGMETVIGFCTQVGQTVAFHCLLAEAAGSILGEGAPLLYSLLRSVGMHLPNVAGDKEIKRMREISTTIGVSEDHDIEWIRSIMEDNVGINDDSWRLLPYLFASFMRSSIWMTSSFDIHLGGFDNNIHCLARCISCLIAGSESIRSEREIERRQSFTSDGYDCDTEEQNHMSTEERIKSEMLIFVKLSALITLDSWNECNRSDVVARIIFLDQICEVSPYLSRSSLEAYIPYAIIGSIYCQYYTNSPPSLELSPMSPSTPRWAPLLYVPTHGGDATPQSTASSSSSSNHLKGQDNHHHHYHHLRETNRVRGLVRMSGPLEYSGGRKLRPAAEARGPNPLPRFAVSRSGPVSYK